MTDEEIAEEFIIERYKIKSLYSEDTEETRVYMRNDVHSDYEELYQVYLAGLKTGEIKLMKEKCKCLK